MLSKLSGLYLVSFCLPIVDACYFDIFICFCFHFCLISTLCVLLAVHKNRCFHNDLIEYMRGQYRNTLCLVFNCGSSAYYPLRP